MCDIADVVFVLFTNVLYYHKEIRNPNLTIWLNNIIKHISAGLYMREFLVTLYCLSRQWGFHNDRYCYEAMTSRRAFHTKSD